MLALLLLWMVVSGRLLKYGSRKTVWDCGVDVWTTSGLAFKHYQAKSNGNLCSQLIENIAITHPDVDCDGAAADGRWKRNVKTSASGKTCYDLK